MPDKKSTRTRKPKPNIEDAPVEDVQVEALQPEEPSVEEGPTVEGGGRAEQSVEGMIHDAVAKREQELRGEAEEMIAHTRASAFQTVVQNLAHREEELSGAIKRFRQTVHIRRGELQAAEEALRAAEDNLIAAEARHDEVKDRREQTQQYLNEAPR